MSKKSSTKSRQTVKRIDLYKASGQLQLLYNAVRASPKINDDDARTLLLAMIQDLVETIGVDWSQKIPPLDPGAAYRLIGRHATAWEPTKGGAK